MWQDGILLCGKVFSKTWRIADINYAVASHADKQDMFLDYSALLNAQEAGASAKISIINRHINRKNFEEAMLLPMRGDALDQYRVEYNNVLLERAMTANNSLVQEKYITITVIKKSIEEARSYFARLGSEMTLHLSALGSFATDLNANERLRIFHDFFRPDNENGFLFDFNASKKRGHSAIDAIAPDSYEHVDGKTFKLGEQYARVLFLREYASYIKDSMISELCDLPRTMMLSIDILPIPTDEALAEIERRVMGADTNITNWQRSQNKGGNFSAEPPPSMERARRETREMYEDITTRNQRMFFGFVSVIHTADTKAQLDEDTDSLQSVGRKCLCQLAPMSFRQIEGMQMAMPFGAIRVGEESFRTLNTESVAVLMPFKAQEINHVGGAYYGQNTISRNLIMIDRAQLLNGNGLIMGVSGSGKSFFGKMDMILRVLASGDDVLCVDPESEYGRMFEALGGEVIRIAADSPHHINALDMSQNYGDNENPIVLKSEFVLSICELVMGHGKLGAKDKSIVDRCIASVYRNYMQSGFSVEPPTLRHFHAELLRQEEPEAQGVALAIELFTSGSLNIFAHQTNVDTQNRLICFDIRDLGKQLKTIGMLVVLDSIFNRITRNRAQGRRTWILIDEIYLLFANEYSSNYLFELWKRIRKYGGFATGITQNVSDMLQSHNARTMLANSEFLVLLNQSATDRLELAKLLNISDTQLSYITNAPAGKGLIRCGAAIVPFENLFPADTELYKLMNTRLSEIQPSDVQEAV